MLEQIDYCPLLYCRVAETKGFLQLPSAAKDIMFPVFRWRPWPNAKLLEKTREKIADAIGVRRFAITLDSFKKADDTIAGTALADFQTLFSPSEGYKAFYNYVESIDRSVPVLQGVGPVPAALEHQFDHVASLDRGAVWLVEYPFSPSGALCKSILDNVADIFVILDAGWGRDILAHQSWASQIVQLLTALRPEIEIVISGSSFPKDFSKIAGSGINDIQERSLFGLIYRQHNAARIKYGDWGSTRRPEPPTPMGIIPARIDVPFVDQWKTYRQTGVESYESIAARALLDNPSLPDLKIWGTYAIESTALGVAGAIGSQAAAAAARINIHLYRQAQSGALTDVSEGDEPYED